MIPASTFSVCELIEVRVRIRQSGAVGDSRAVTRSPQRGPYLERLRRTGATRGALCDEGLKAMETGHGVGDTAFESDDFEIARGIDDGYRAEIGRRSFEGVGRGSNARRIGVFDGGTNGRHARGTVLEEHAHDLEQQAAIAAGMPVEHREVDSRPGVVDRQGSPLAEGVCSASSSCSSFARHGGQMEWLNCASDRSAI